MVICFFTAYYCHCIICYKFFNTIDMKNHILTTLLFSSIFLLHSYPIQQRIYADSNNLKLTQAKSAYMIDADSKQVLYEENPTLHLPIASVCKVMTLSLVFDAIKDHKLSFEDSVIVSQNASSMGGSQVFLQTNLSYQVSELIKSIVVCSANDSCVALAEKIYSSEQDFVKQMNIKAQELHCDNTIFANCTGLPKQTQYSCAKDVATMFSYLISNPEYYSFSHIWLEKFDHPDNRQIIMTNTNKLLRRYQPCDGGKTGFTQEAGYCFASTAQKDNLRLISVVLGEKTSDQRFDDTIKLFNYGFDHYEQQVILDSSLPLNDNFYCPNSDKKYYSIAPARDCYYLKPKGKQIKTAYILNDLHIKAPIQKGQVVGSVAIYQDNILFDEVDVVAYDDVEKQSWGNCIKDVADQWHF